MFPEGRTRQADVLHLRTPVVSTVPSPGQPCPGLLPWLVLLVDVERELSHVLERACVAVPLVVPCRCPSLGTGWTLVCCFAKLPELCWEGIWGLLHLLLFQNTAPSSSSVCRSVFLRQEEPPQCFHRVPQRARGRVKAVQNRHNHVLLCGEEF